MPTKSRAQAYLDGDARSFPLSVEVARDCIQTEAEWAQMKAENDRLRAVAEAAENARINASFGSDDCFSIEEDVFLVLINALDALETKGPTDANRE